MSIMPDGPVMTQGAWKGSDLQPDSGKWLHVITDQERDELRSAVAEAREKGLTLPHISPRVFSLPTLGPRLHRLTREMAEGVGFTLLRGFPASGMSVADIEVMYFGCMTYLGLPIAQDSKNTLIGHVRDTADANQKRRGYQTSRRLGYHSDSSDVVGLLCVHPAKSGGLSRIVSAVTIHNIIQAERPDLLRVLYNQPYYCSWAGQEPAGQLPYYWVHFYSWYGGRLQTSSIKERYVDWPPMTQEQGAALDFIQRILADRESELVLDMDFQPGDVQLLDNSIIWHSRTAFVDDDDPLKHRHLLRAWLNYYVERPVASDFWNRYQLVGQSTASPKRRLFDVEIYDTW